MRRRVQLAMLLVWIGSLLGGTDLAAQSLNLSGTIDDGAGVVPEAIVIVQDAAGVVQQAVTGGDGKFRIGGLRAGVHQVSVNRDGYAPTARTVTLGDQSAIADFTLQVAG